MSRTKHILSVRVVFIAVALLLLLLLPIVGISILGGDAGVKAVMAQEILAGEILFTCNDGDNEVCVMNANGSEITQLTENIFSDTDAMWSPDGRRIVFVSTRDGNPEIYVMDADGLNQTRLLAWPGSVEQDPAWSPDGTHIAFVSNAGGNWGIYVMDADGSNPTDSLTYGLSPAWLNNQTIIFNALQDDNYQIWSMSIFGDQFTVLAGNPPYECDPDPSPDSTRITFVSDCNGDDSIYVMDADGSNQTPLTEGKHPSWSPDGRRIVFERDGDIYIMNPDGSNQIRIGEGSDPAWNPVPPEPAVVVEPIAMNMSENGDSDTFIINLTTEPLADVQIDLSSDDTGECTVAPTQVTLNSDNWDEGVDVTITAADDLFADGDKTCTIETTMSSAANDYNGINPANVTVTVTDDDNASVVVEPASTEISEPGDETTITFKLTSQPLAPFNLDLRSSDESECVLSSTQINFAYHNWQAGVEVTVMAVDDDVADGEQTCTIETDPISGAENDYNGINPADVDVTVQDDDISPEFSEQVEACATWVKLNGTVADQEGNIFLADMLSTYEVRDYRFADDGTIIAAIWNTETNRYELVEFSELGAFIRILVQAPQGADGIFFDLDDADIVYSFTDKNWDYDGIHMYSLETGETTDLWFVGWDPTVGGDARHTDHRMDPSFGPDGTILGVEHSSLPNLTEIVSLKLEDSGEVLSFSSLASGVPRQLDKNPEYSGGSLVYQGWEMNESGEPKTETEIVYALLIVQDITIEVGQGEEPDVSPDGREVLFVSPDGKIVRFDLVSGQEENLGPGSSPVWREGPCTAPAPLPNPIIPEPVVPEPTNPITDTDAITGTGEITPTIPVTDTEDPVIPDPVEPVTDTVPITPTVPVTDTNDPVNPMEPVPNPMNIISGDVGSYEFQPGGGLTMTVNITATNISADDIVEMPMDAFLWDNVEGEVPQIVGTSPLTDSQQVQGSKVLAHWNNVGKLPVGEEQITVTLDLWIPHITLGENECEYRLQMDVATDITDTRGHTKTGASAGIDIQFVSKEGECRPYVVSHIQDFSAEAVCPANGAAGLTGQVNLSLTTGEEYGEFDASGVTILRYINGVPTRIADFSLQGDGSNYTATDSQVPWGQEVFYYGSLVDREGTILDTRIVPVSLDCQASVYLPIIGR